MPRYHFNIHNGTGFTPDTEGRELPDLGIARDEAVAGIRSLIAEEVSKGQIDLDGRIEVEDGSGGTVMTVRFLEAVEIRLPPASPADAGRHA